MENNFGTPPGDRYPPATNPKDAVSLPAILLMVTSAMTLLYGLFGLVRPVDEESLAMFTSNPDLAQFHGVFEFLTSTSGRLLASAPLLIINALTFVGALKMRGLQSYGLAMAGAIAALVPCCGACYCLGMPLGIWALVVLRKPEVKAAFT